MESFKGMNRDTTRVKTPTGMWEFARNILLQKGFNSISNEYGFDIKANIPGVVIGVIPTNEETVVFSIDGDFSCIGIIKADDLFTYIPKIRSIYLGFKINRPIEGVFLYNYNKELITIWCDGIFVDSNLPRLMNLTTIGVDLDINLEFINPDDVNTLSLFNSTSEAKLSISYGNPIVLPLNIVYITYTYIQEDGISTTGYYPVHHIAYPFSNWTAEVQRSIIVTLSELDTKYTQLRLGLLVNFENSLIGYSSPVFNYTGTDLTIEITSLTNFEEVAANDLVIPTIMYNRIKTMTIQNNQLVVGNVAVDNQYNLQKFVNNLELGLKFVIDPTKHSHPTLCPDEVYAVYIQPQLKNSEYLEAFPLIGPEPNLGNERDILTNADLEALGLRGGGNGIEADTWKRFHIINTGGFVLPAPFVENNEAHLEMNWGFWENEEVYPNDDQFNGTIDYNGNPIPGGVDVRNTPIKYFRMPGLDAVTDKIPCILGYDYINRSNNNFFTVGQDPTQRFRGYVPRFGVYIKNWEDAIPEEIRDNFQGFRLLIVKRKSGDRLVETISFCNKVTRSEQEVDGTDRLLDVCIFEEPTPNAPDAHSKNILYGYSRIYNNTLFNFKPQITPKIVKANYGYRRTRDTVTSSPVITNNAVRGVILPTWYKVRETQKYAEFKSLTYKPGNNIEANTLFVEENIMLESKNYLAGALVSLGTTPFTTNYWNPLGVYSPTGSNLNNMYADVLQFNHVTRVYDAVTLEPSPNDNLPFENGISISLISLYKNVFLGFAPKDFISLGRVSTTNSTEVLSDNGDIFTNNGYSGITTKAQGSSILGKVRFIDETYKGGWSVLGNSLISMAKDKTLGPFYDVDDDGSQAGFLLGLNYTIDLLYIKDPFKSLNDYLTAIAFDVNGKTVGYFPFRVARTPKISNENLQTDVLRTFRANDYYEMLNNRGEVIAVRGTNKELFIQQKYSLFVARLKDKLNTGESETYLGEGDIFDRSPDEIKYNTDKGYIGCTNQFACIISPDGYVVVDQLKGNIFLVGGKMMEVSKLGMSNWFQDNWNTEGYFTLDRFGNKQPVDNPFVSIGHLIGYDEEFNRLLFTKKYYRFLFEEDLETLYTFDGEFYYRLLEEEVLERLDFNDETYFENLSKTFSFSLNDTAFVCEHDYFPNVYFNNTHGLFSINNDRNTLTNSVDYYLYKHNSKTKRRGTYYKDVTYDSYIDLIFNNRLDLTKHYQAVTWESVVKSLNSSRQYTKTIDRIMLYSDYQCSGEVDITQYNTSRNVEGIWQYNEFRDVVIDSTLPIVREDGRVNETNINSNKSYFEKSFFIGTFVVIRLIMANANTDDVYINFVNVKSRISKR